MNIWPNILLGYATCGVVLGGGSSEQLRALIRAHDRTGARAVPAGTPAAPHRPAAEPWRPVEPTDR